MDEKSKRSVCKTGGNEINPKHCSHLHFREIYSSENFEYLRTCDAFPAGIPLDIFHGERSHLAPVLGDNGICYEPSDNG